MRLLLPILMLVGCGDDLPAASLIDKLRVLAVQLEPPEVAPGNSVHGSVLAVEPLVKKFDDVQPTQAFWLACHTPPGSLQPLPCAVTENAIPPLCSDNPSATTCIVGRGLEIDYRPDGSALGADGTGEVLLTVVAADNGTPEQCLADIQANGGLPKYPDRCVVAFKRLVINGNAGAALNQNPELTALWLKQDELVEPLDGAQFPVGSEQSTPTLKLLVDRVPGSAELDANGNYEALTVSWFTTSGKIDGGRSAFDPEGCATAADCPMKEPSIDSSTSWIVPKDTTLAVTADSSRTVKFWAVVRDDRGGVSWLTGTAEAE